MDLIIKSRGHGKTTDLVRMSSETSIPILTQHVDSVKDVANRMGVTIPNPIRYAEYPLRYRGKPVYIDELGAFLHSIGVNARGCTVSIDE